MKVTVLAMMTNYDDSNCGGTCGGSRTGVIGSIGPGDVRASAGDGDRRAGMGSGVGGVPKLPDGDTVPVGSVDCAEDVGSCCWWLWLGRQCR
jgi:hypothetical protein